MTTFTSLLFSIFPFAFSCPRTLRFHFLSYNIHLISTLVGREASRQESSPSNVSIESLYMLCWFHVNWYDCYLYPVSTFSTLFTY